MKEYDAAQPVFEPFSTVPSARSERTETIMIVDLLEHLLTEVVRVFVRVKATR